MDPSLNPANLPYNTGALFGPLGPVSVKAFQRQDATYSSLRNTTTASNEVNSGGASSSGGGGGGEGVDLTGIIEAIGQLESQIMDINSRLAAATIDAVCSDQEIIINLNIPN